ncbi:MAG: hypothetical protein ABSC24_13460 [Verrucomicrobiota bacterium]
MASGAGRLASGFRDLASGVWRLASGVGTSAAGAFAALDSRLSDAICEYCRRMKSSQSASISTANTSTFLLK